MTKNGNDLSLDILFAELADGRLVGKSLGAPEADTPDWEWAYVDRPSIHLKKNGLVVKYSSIFDP